MAGLFDDFDEPERDEPARIPGPDDPDRPLARKSHPETSHEAASQIRASLAALHRWTADCIRQTPGLTARELAQRYCPTDPRKIGRRLNECEDLGMIVRGVVRVCRVSGRRATTWMPPAGGTA